MTKKQIKSWRKRVYAFISEVPGLTIEEYEGARKSFSEQGVDFAHIPKGWRFWKWVTGRPAQIILWCGPGLVRDYLGAPSRVIAELARLENEFLAKTEGNA